MEKCKLKITVNTNNALEITKNIMDELAKLNLLAAKYIEQGFEVVTLDCDLATTSATSECRTIFEPTDQLLLFVATLRTFNLDAGRLIDFKFKHNEPPVVDGTVSDATVNPNVELRGCALLRSPA